MTYLYEILADDLKAAGVEVVFGLISEEFCQLAAAVDARGIRFVNTRHENSAVVAAAGYSTASGKLGVAMIGRGPALANAMHAITSASRTGASVLLMIGDAPMSDENPDGIGPDIKAYSGRQLLEASGIATAAATCKDVARPEMARAIGLASKGRLAAFHMPSDILAGVVDAGQAAPAIAKIHSHRPVEARRPSLDIAVSVLANSRRPVIVAGLGAHKSGARDAIERLAEKIGALLVNSLKGKELFRGSPWILGILGSSSHSLARRYVEQADCVITFGASLNRFTMTSGTALPEVAIIQIDKERANIGRWWYADVGIVGDAKLVAEQLLNMVEDRAEDAMPFRSDAVQEEIAAFSHEQDFEPLTNGRVIDPRTLAIELDKIFPEDRHLVFDGGNHMAAWAYVTAPSPSHFNHISDFGSIGLGMGTAIGVACARPEACTVTFQGDGGLLMTLGELETIAREQLPVLVVVMNDAAFGAEVHILRSHRQSPSTAKFADVDFATIAEAMGYETAVVTSVADLEQVAAMLARFDGPALIDCKINGEVIAPFISEFLPKDG